MPYDAPPSSTEYSTAELRRALHYLALMMKAHPDGKKLVPVFRALKQKIEEARAVEEILVEALDLVKA
jgi:hypothetical protein